MQLQSKITDYVVSRVWSTENINFCAGLFEWLQSFSILNLTYSHEVKLCPVAFKLLALYHVSMTFIERTPINMDSLACPFGVRINRVPLQFEKLAKPHMEY